MSYIFKISSFLIMILCFSYCSTNVESEEIKRQQIIELIENYGLTSHIKLVEDFDYSVSLAEVEEALKSIEFSQQPVEIREGEIPDDIQLKMQERQTFLQEQAKQYLETLREVNNKADSLTIAREFGFKLPIKNGDRTVITPNAATVYQID